MSCATAGITTPPSAKCTEIYDFGLRNPFRFAFDPNTGNSQFFINDVGGSTWEEVDLGGKGPELRVGHPRGVLRQRLDHRLLDATSPVHQPTHRLPARQRLRLRDRWCVRAEWRLVAAIRRFISLRRWRVRGDVAENTVGHGRLLQSVRPDDRA